MTRKSRIQRVLVAAATAAFLSGTGAALAQNQPDDLRLDDAWADLTVNQEPILTESQFAKLNNLAFQAAVTNVCDGYQLDQKKFADGLNDATTPAPTTIASPDEMKDWETAVYFRLGASYGLFLAEGNAHADAFCKSAADLKGDSTVPNVWQ